VTKRSRASGKRSSAAADEAPKSRGRNDYERASTLARGGRIEDARAIYTRLGANGLDPTGRARIANDLGVLAAVEGDLEFACQQLQSALSLDRTCAAALDNVALLEECRRQYTNRDETDQAPIAAAHSAAGTQIKVAILSFLFNWPSTGGGIVHTVELAHFLGKAGYEVEHFYASNLEWGVGNVTSELPIVSHPLEFTTTTWHASEIQRRYREAVTEFNPDYVIITDCWNMKPLLAEAVRDYPYLLRQQALELLCPLNNLRLLPGEAGRVRQCPKNHLATPEACHQCLVDRGHMSGGLHQAERALAEVGTAKYQDLLRRSLLEAEAVLVHNPILETIYSPYATNVRVATWGMDAARFPWPWPLEPPRLAPIGVTVLIMAGLVSEYIKGFHVLQEACARLWCKRSDFLLVATGDPPGQFNEFTHFTGWLSQADLPRYIRGADILVMPSIAQEALSRTSVEAMGVGRPVVASRIGGLPYTVTDGATGLLCEPGNPDDLAAKIETLLDDPGLRQRMGDAGRKRFEAEFTWEQVIDRCYRPLLKARAYR